MSSTIHEANALALKESGLGNHQAAADIYRHILAEVSGNPEIYNNYGTVLHGLTRYDESVAIYDKAIALKADYPDAYYNRGNSFMAMGRYEEALASFNRAIALKPELAQAYNNRGLVLNAMERYAEASASYKKALSLKADYPIAYYNHGTTLYLLGLYNEALASYDKAIAQRPDFAEAYNNRGNSLRALRRFAEARTNFEKAAALKPDIPYVSGALLYMQMYLCQWQGLYTLVAALAKAIEAGQLAADPFSVLAASLSLRQQRQCAELYSKDKFPLRPVRLWNGERYSHKKIRIAYVSADFREHAVSFLLAGVLEWHDKTRFELYGISLKPEEKSATGQRVKAAFDRFIDVSQKSDKETAQLMRELEIDIAVDLMGFTAGCRTAIFAWRPAPVQVNYLGYPAMMGTDYTDYIIADAVVIPPQSRDEYHEKVVYLPDCFQANDDKKAMSQKKPSRAQYGLPEDAFVFCSFNNNYKITPDVFDIWMRLLKKIDGSVLWLLEDNQVAAKNLRAEAVARGVADNRLVFAGRVVPADHLARHQLADLFLDTFYYNAHTTASDALWAGLPLVTCPGESFAARVASSLLNAVGLPELITHSHAQYEALALELATDSKKLSAIRRKLEKNRTTWPLFDTALYTRHLEDAYIKMWERSQAGAALEHIYVT